MKREYEENPYLSARAEYGDRYGAAVNEAARWRQIAFFLLMLCLAFGGMMIWMSTQNKVIPYVVQVDKQGYSVAIKSAEQGSAADMRVVVASLSRFFSNFKTVVVDTYAQRAMVNDVYGYLARGSSAESIVTHYYRENNPFSNTDGNTTLVEVKSVLAVGGGGTSWQVLWTENKIRRGEVTSSTEWRAIVTIAISPVRDLADVIKNPLGIYITELNMAQDVVTDDD
ncbi:MAG: conjugal transfer protein TrbF [Fretibacterium sp.]|nr:conjugal transfer protein TrbF [Fretibacterium sp.]